LSQKIILLEALNDALTREARALTLPGQDEILSLAEEKRTLAMRLADLCGELDRLLKHLGYPADGEGLARCVGEAHGEAELAQLHRRAIEGLRACLTDNRTVGALLQRRRSAIERALRILFDSPDRANLYRASGRLQAANPNHYIGEA
jgi:flagellar biosynthesis/type III secretory pathway chaperone